MKRSRSVVPSWWKTLAVALAASHVAAAIVVAAPRMLAGQVGWTEPKFTVERTIKVGDMADIRSVPTEGTSNQEGKSVWIFFKIRNTTATRRDLVLTQTIPNDFLLFSGDARICGHDMVNGKQTVTCRFGEYPTGMAHEFGYLYTIKKGASCPRNAEISAITAESSTHPKETFASAVNFGIQCGTEPPAALVPNPDAFTITHKISPVYQAGTVKEFFSELTMQNGNYAAPLDLKVEVIRPDPVGSLIGFFDGPATQSGLSGDARGVCNSYYQTGFFAVAGEPYLNCHFIVNTHLTGKPTPTAKFTMRHRVNSCPAKLPGIRVTNLTSGKVVVTEERTIGCDVSPDGPPPPGGLVAKGAVSKEIIPWQGSVDFTGTVKNLSLDPKLVQIRHNFPQDISYVPAFRGEGCTLEQRRAIVCSRLLSPGEKFDLVVTYKWEYAMCSWDRYRLAKLLITATSDGKTIESEPVGAMPDCIDPSGEQQFPPIEAFTPPEGVAPASPSAAVPATPGEGTVYTGETPSTPQPAAPEPSACQCITPEVLAQWGITVTPEMCAAPVGSTPAPAGMTSGQGAAPAAPAEAEWPSWAVPEGRNAGQPDGGKFSIGTPAPAANEETPAPAAIEPSVAPEVSDPAPSQWWNAAPDENAGQDPRTDGGWQAPEGVQEIGGAAEVPGGRDFEGESWVNPAPQEEPEAELPPTLWERWLQFLR